MSRSARHSPFIGVTTTESEKAWKKLWSRKLRRAATVAISCMREVPLSIGKKWGPKDGKRRIKDSEPNAIRMMRK